MSWVLIALLISSSWITQFIWPFIEAIIIIFKALPVVMCGHFLPACGQNRVGDYRASTLSLTTVHTVVL